MAASNLKDGLHKPFHEDCYKQLANFRDSFKNGLRKLTLHERAWKQLAKFSDNFKNGLQKPTFLEVAYVRQWRPTLSKIVFTGTPSMRMAYKQLAMFNDNFKDGLHKPTFLEDGLHAPTEADISKESLHMPTFREDSFKQLAKFGNNFKDGLHKPTFLEDDCMHQRRPTISRMTFTSPPSTCRGGGGLFGGVCGPGGVFWWCWWCVALLVGVRLLVVFVCAFWLCFVLLLALFLFVGKKGSKKREGAGTGQERESSCSAS